MALAVATPPAIPVKLIGVLTLLAVGLGSRASRAQVQSVANAESVTTSGAPAASSALQEWEDALVAADANAESWSTIGRRLYAAERYRECIAALERAMLLRNRRSPGDAHVIAQAYARLGNAKQAARWGALAVDVAASRSPAHKSTD